MERVNSVIGPLYAPAKNSGITFPTCTHVAPDSCPVCDGTLAELIHLEPVNVADLEDAA